jgi:DNA transposition AAA+ family ATPase
VASFPSQAQASANLKGVSEATIIQVQKGNWSTISTAMLRNIGKQIGMNTRDEWQIVETRDFKTIASFIDDAKVYGNVHAICAATGSGKTFTAQHCARTMQNVFHLECAEYWNKKQFLNELLAKLGKENAGRTTGEAMELIVTTILRLDEPVIILDEADKLSDSVLYFFITLYNKLHNSCGIVLMATDHLAKRIERGRKLNRKGYAEIYSRISRRYLPLKGSTSSELKALCMANGVNNDWTINEIINEAEGDLRRVERAVHKYKLQQQRLQEKEVAA